MHTRYWLLNLWRLQAIDHLDISDKLSGETKTVYDDLRQLFPKFDSDYPIYKDIEKVIAYLTSTHKTILQ